MRNPLDKKLVQNSNVGIPINLYNQIVEYVNQQKANGGPDITLRAVIIRSLKLFFASRNQVVIEMAPPKLVGNPESSVLEVGEDWQQVGFPADLPKLVGNPVAQRQAIHDRIRQTLGGSK